MGFGSHYVSSPGFCLSTEDYREQCELQDYYKNMRNYCTNITEEKIDSGLVLFKFTLLR